MISTTEGIKASKEEGPPVVHCSAGVGRSGSWIVISFMLETIQQALQSERIPTLNLMKTVDLIRAQVQL